MILVNDTKTFSEAFQNTNFRFNLVSCEFEFYLCTIRSILHSLLQTNIHTLLSWPVCQHFSFWMPPPELYNSLNSSRPGNKISSTFTNSFSATSSPDASYQLWYCLRGFPLHNISISRPNPFPVYWKKYNKHSFQDI